MVVGPEYLIRMRGALKEFCDFTSVYFHEQGNLPAAGSQALAETASSPRPQSLGSSWPLAIQLIELAADHLLVFCKTIKDPVEIMAAWTCVRSMLESCSLAAWFVDPKIDAHTRVGRVFAHLYQGSIHQQKFMRAIGNHETEIQAEKDRIDRYEAELTALGYPRVPPVGKRMGLCEEMPHATAIIESVLGEGNMYRLMSAVAHGHFWAIHKIGYTATGDNAEVGGVTMATFDRTIDFNGLGLLGHIAMKALATPVWNLAHYFGWNVLKVEEIFENTADKLIVKEELRFWRSTI